MRELFLLCERDLCKTKKEKCDTCAKAKEHPLVGRHMMPYKFIEECGAEQYDPPSKTEYFPSVIGDLKDVFKQWFKKRFV